VRLWLRRPTTETPLQALPTRQYALVGHEVRVLIPGTDVNTAL
jgi:hypothetical protein